MNRKVIYRIFPKSDAIEQSNCYIGSSSNFTNRKSVHKLRCNNVNNKYHNYYIYKFIRENGGWDNFDFEILKELNLNIEDKKQLQKELLKEEYKYMNIYNPKLNRRKIIIKE